MPPTHYSSVSNIGYIWSSEEGSDERRIVLNNEQVGLDAIVKTLTLDERTFRRPGALHVVPHQFVRVEFRRIAGQEVQFQFAAARVDVVLHHLGLVGRQAVEDEKQRLLATAHDVAEHCYEQLGAHCALVRCKPEGAFGVDGGSRRYRLTGARHRNNRGAPFDAPGRALHHIGTKTGFIPEYRSRPHGAWPVPQCSDRCRASRPRSPPGRAHKRASTAFAASAPSRPATCRPRQG